VRCPKTTAIITRMNMEVAGCKELASVYGACFCWHVLCRQERGRLCQRWLEECKGEASQEVALLLQHYSEAQAALQAEYDRATLAALKSARVVGMTTSGVAKLQRVVAALHPKVALLSVCVLQLCCFCSVKVCT
jgi:hypothetical protein